MLGWGVGDVQCRLHSCPLTSILSSFQVGLGVILSRVDAGAGGRGRALKKVLECRDREPALGVGDVRDGGFGGCGCWDWV